jgi:hypothetical protein
MATGGKREGAGRKPGKVSAAKRELMDMAKDHADRALATLAQIMADPNEPASARVSAANAILDRGYGKPFQAMQITGDASAPIHMVQHVVIDPPPRE